MGTNPILTVRKKPTFSTDPQLSTQTVTRCCHTKSFLGKRQREGCTHRTEGWMCRETETKRTAQGHPRVAEEKEPGALTRLWRTRAEGEQTALPTFTALFRLWSYQGLQEITYPLLQHCLKQTPYFINSSFSGLQASFPLGACGEPFWLQNFGDNTLFFINPFSGRMCKPEGLKHQVHIHQRQAL